jgi:hypothetical protein
VGERKRGEGRRGPAAGERGAREEEEWEGCEGGKCRCHKEEFSKRRQKGGVLKSEHQSEWAHCADEPQTLAAHAFEVAIASRPRIGVAPSTAHVHVRAATARGPQRVDARDDVLARPHPEILSCLWRNLRAQHAMRSVEGWGWRYLTSPNRRRFLGGACNRASSVANTGKTGDMQSRKHTNRRTCTHIHKHTHTHTHTHMHACV